MSATGEAFVKLGNAAAKKFLDEKVPLDDAIRQIKTAQNLNAEETKRVVENANRAVFTSLFHSLPADNKTVDFQIADVKAILGGEAAPVVKAASVDGRFRRHRTDGFRVSKHSPAQMDEYFEKAASLVKKASNREVIQNMTPDRKWQLVKQASEKIRGKYVVAERHLDMTKAAFRKEAREAIKKSSLQYVLEALVPLTKRAEHLMLLEPEIAWLRNHALLKEGEFRQVWDRPNPNHPLIRTYTDLIKAAGEYDDRKFEYDYAAFEEKRLRKEIASERRTQLS